jgi:hypothetical protein
VLYNCTCYLTSLWNLVSLEEKQTWGISLNFIQMSSVTAAGLKITKDYITDQWWSWCRGCLIGSLSKSNPSYWLHHQFNTSKYRKMWNFLLNNTTVYDHSSSHAFFKFYTFPYFGLMMRLHYEARGIGNCRKWPTLLQTCLKTMKNITKYRQSG